MINSEIFQFHKNDAVTLKIPYYFLLFFNFFTAVVASVLVQNQNTRKIMLFQHEYMYVCIHI